MAKKGDAWRYWRDAAGRWRRSGPTGGGQFAAPPSGLYRDRAGRWRDASAGHRFAPTPGRVRKPKTAGLRQRGSDDWRAVRRVRRVFEHETGEEWDFRRLDAIGDDFGNVAFRVVVEYRPRLRLGYEEVTAAIAAAREDELVRSTFAYRRTLWTVRFHDSRAGSGEATLAHALAFGVATDQALSKLESLSQRYGASRVESDDPRDKPSLISLVRLWVE